MNRSTDMIDFAAFYDELEKIAFGWDDMSRVLRLSRARTVKLPSRLSPMGPLSVPAASMPAQRAAVAAAVAAGQMSEVAGARILRALRNIGGKALIPKGGSSRWLESVGWPRGTVRGKERKALDTLMRGHELDELAVKRFDPAYVGKATHMDPDVVLKERNRLLTLPREVKPAVTKAMVPLRTTLESPVLEKATRTVSGKGLQYGEGPRLSRHARKRISKRMKEITALPETPSAMEVLQKMQAGG